MADVVVAFNHFREIAKALPYAGTAACKVLADAIGEESQHTAPYDTVHMSQANYTVTDDTSSYDRVVHDGPTNAPVDHPGPGVALAVNAAPYAIPVNYGTRNMAAQPWFTHAAFYVANHPPADLAESFLGELYKRAGLI